MSDIKSAPHITHTATNTGLVIRINDHVYLAPEHLGEPYYIGRIMEFCTARKRKGLLARIAWFNRPKDVINRQSADPCLLVATMHSDVNPVSSIRGKCTVTHKYYVPKDQIDAYRKKQDHFYYNQLYDRYIQRVYDVLPCELVQNVPMDILDALKQRYQFIVVEQGKGADLTTARRMCCVCQEWAQSALSVRCAACQKSYHMTCLNPPLLRKPSKGFAWQCAFCTRQELVISSEKPTPAPQKEKRQTRSSRSQSSKLSPASEKPTEISEKSIKLKINQPKKTASSGGYRSQQIKMTHMWPFRYFGVNTNIRDILDVDDRIYPRAKSRIGARYQAFVPDFEPSSSRSLSPLSDIQSPKSRPNKKPDRKMKLNTPKNKRSADASPVDTTHAELFDSEPTIPTRGSDNTVTCIYKPEMISEEQVDDYMEKVKALKHLPLAPHSSDLMDRALVELETHNYDVKAALESMSRLKEKDFAHVVNWSKEETEAFEQSIRENGHDLNYAKKSVQTKDMSDIVRYFYQWKKTERYEPVYSEWTKIYRPTKKFKKFPRNPLTGPESVEDKYEVSENEEEEEEADPTIVPKATYSKRSYQCMNCLTNSSKIWRRSPSDIDRKRKVFNKVLCDDCGIYWLKYAKTKPIPPEAKSNNGSNSSASNTPVLQSNGTNEDNDKKRKRPNDSMSTKIIVKKIKEEKKQDTPEVQEPAVCIICSSSNASARIYSCMDCGMVVHNDCYGIDPSQDKLGWRCDPCDNKYHPVSSYTYECILCFNSSNKPHQPLKKTAGYYWAHVQCATFIPEIKFVHPHLLSPVEYVGCVNVARLDADCQLCYETRGACVACSECKKTVHVQCAIDNQFKLAFEIQSNTHNSNKFTKFPIMPTGFFGPSSPSGLMIPQVWCPHHSISNRKLIELNTRATNDTQDSSLMTFAKNYKCVAKGTTPAMRRLLGSKHIPSKVHHPKIPNPREATIEALTMEEQLIAPTTKSTKLSTLLTNSKPSPRIKRTCASEGCSVQHTPIWWSVDSISDKKICQRCHHQQKKLRKDV